MTDGGGERVGRVRRDRFLHPENHLHHALNLILLRGTAMPQMGHVGFSILCTNAPPSSPGALLLGSRPLEVPMVVLGAALSVDPTSAVLMPLASSAIGRSDVQLPIPRQPALIGSSFYTQAFWRGPAAPPPCPPLGFSSSFGLAITVQP